LLLLLPQPGKADTKHKPRSAVPEKRRPVFMATVYR